MQFYFKNQQIKRKNLNFISYFVIFWLLILVILYDQKILIAHSSEGKLQRINDEKVINKLNINELKFKVITYNIACGQGLKNSNIKIVGTDFLKQIVKQLEAEDADFIGMQEVDDNWYTSYFVNQAEFIGSHLGMNYFWAPASALDPFNKIKKHGNMVMTKYKILKKECIKYKARGKSKSITNRAASETRSFTYILCEVSNNLKINFISTHLGFPEEARFEQAKELMEFIQKLKEPIILVGDFNTTQNSKTYNLITTYLNDSCLIAKNKGKNFTLPSNNPKVRIDFIFISNDFICEEAYAGGDEYKNLSDHRPFISILKLKPISNLSNENLNSIKVNNSNILKLKKSLYNSN